MPSRPSRNAAPAAPSGPVTTRLSPGLAPPRPGTRLERPSAVTLSSTRSDRRRVSARDRHSGLVQALVQGQDVVELGVRGDRERDDERLGLGPGGGEVAEVDGRRPVAQLPPAEEVETEVDVLDERVLRDDELADLRRVVLDALGEPAPLELGQQAYLTELREPH